MYYVNYTHKNILQNNVIYNCLILVGIVGLTN